MCFFFFKQKTAYEMRISDWSSDVCSSDLGSAGQQVAPRDQMVRILPPGERRRRAGVEFVAIADQDQPPVRVRVPRHRHDAHAFSSRFSGGLINGPRLSI